MNEDPLKNENETEPIISRGFLRAIVITVLVCGILLFTKAYITNRQEQNAINSALFNLNNNSSQSNVPDGWQAIGYDNDGNPIKWVDELGNTWASGKSVSELERIEELANNLSPFHRTSYTSTDDDGYQIQFNVTVSDWIFSNDEEMKGAILSKLGHSTMRMPTNEELHYLENNVEIKDYYGTKNIEYNTSNILMAIGKIEYKNVTPGFSITTDNPYKKEIELGFVQIDRETGYQDITSDYSKMARLALYNPSNDSFFVLTPAVSEDDMLCGKFTNFNNNGSCSMTMNSDYASGFFVLAIPNKITPNYPTGDPALDDCVLGVYELIQFNGEYIDHPIEPFE